MKTEREQIDAGERSEMAGEQEALRLDLEELRHLETIAKRPRILSLLSTEIRDLDAKMPMAVTASAAAPSPVLVKKEPTAAVNYVKISFFSWGQNNDQIQIHVFLEGVKEEKIETVLKPMSVDIKFHNVQGKNYRCVIPKLNKEILPDKCKVLVKPRDVLNITLFKASEGNWLDLYFKEDKTFKRKGTIEAHDSMWQNKLEISPDATKFRYIGLAQEPQLDICLSDVAGTGKHAWTPASGVLPPCMQSVEGGDEYDGNDMSAAADKILNVEVIPGESQSQRKHRKDNVARKKPKKLSGAAKLSMTLDRIVDVLESCTTKIGRVAYGCSVRECIDALAAIPGVVRGDPLFIFGARLFTSQAQREMFVALGDHEIRRRYLLAAQHYQGLGTTTFTLT